MIDVGQTFRENEILLTGTSGFLGKVVLGLLLDRYPDCKHLHVLMRPARGLEAAERFEHDVLGSPALRPSVERARGRAGEPLSQKFTVWPGDIALPSLGLSPQDLDRLAGGKLLIINCAGRVDFFPPLDDSLHSNVDGVEHLMALARRLGASLLHVSTCFVCGEADGLIEETEPILGFYPHRKGHDDPSFHAADELSHCRDRLAEIYRTAGSNGNLAEIARRRPRELAQRLTALGRQRAEHWGWVNTYTYSKSLGEQVLAAETGIPWTIVRPAIIESALEFPFPGWIEGGRTAAPLVLMALGGMKEWPMRRDAALEVVPVDQVAAAILVAGALLLRGEHRAVYQLASADVNPIHLEPLVRLLHAETRRLGSRGTPRPGAARRKAPPLVQRWASGSTHRGQVRFLSAAQARAHRTRQERRIERLQSFIGRTRGMLQTLGLPGHETLAGWSSALRTLGLQARFREQTLEQYLPFVLHNRFVFECENIRAAYELISPKDRALLPWAPEKIDWVHYWTHNQVRGIQKWVQPEAVKDWSFQI
ncbi:MAG TPA: SDR family oxidoreductase [Terriglobia bacterium]|nr:SDR family oxidoreductase [Terriglobia bacterium]